MSASGPQRWNPVGGFCEKLLPSDRWPWSDVSGLQHRPLDGVALPSPHWEWESDWYVDENFGGEPTEKGVGELSSGSCSHVGRELFGLRPSLQCCPPRPVAAYPSLCPVSSPLSAWGQRGSVLLPLFRPVPCLPQLYYFLPQSLTQHSPGISGMDVCHGLPCHLHKRQEVEFLCAAEEVDPIQEIQVPGHLGQGLQACVCPGGGTGPDRSPTARRVTRTLISALPPCAQGTTLPRWDL